MDPFATVKGYKQDTDTWTIETLKPTPVEEWRRLYHFLNITSADINAMLQTVEALFRRGQELVVDTYDYLLQHHETAAILGWERGADETHLAERRRFFTVWLARTLGLDFSAEFAGYLFKAGQIHAAHGPRRIHVPAVYVTGSISLVNATFARFLSEEMPGDSILPAALAGWNKVLNLHLHMMLQGYAVARQLDDGDFPVNVALYAKMRSLTGTSNLVMHLPHQAVVADALRKFFNYYPQTRSEVFDIDWRDGERVDESGTPWFVPETGYRIKPMWRVLLNGKDISYIGGPQSAVKFGDEISIFPPGR